MRPSEVVVVTFAMVAIALALFACTPSATFACDERFPGCEQEHDGTNHTAAPVLCFGISCDHFAMRGPSSGRGFPDKKSWVHEGIPVVYGPTQIQITEAEMRAALTAGINTWTSISDSLPKDDLWASQYVTPNYSIRWRSQEEVGLGRVAVTTPEWGGGAHPCRFSNTIMTFAIDPVDFNNNRLFWTSNCLGTGCSYNEMDIRNVAVHEFGHAYGLYHSCADPQATMYGEPSLQDTCVLTPTAPELALIRQMYRDNFTPAMVESFVVITGLPALVWLKTVTRAA